MKGVFMLKETLKDLSEMLDDDMQNVKSIYIKINDDNSISFEVSEDDSNFVKHKLDKKDIENAEFMALMDIGTGILMTKTAAEIEQLVCGEELFFGEKDNKELRTLNIVNGLFKLIAESQNTKYQLKVFKR